MTVVNYPDHSPLPSLLHTTTSVSFGNIRYWNADAVLNPDFFSPPKPGTGYECRYCGGFGVREVRGGGHECNGCGVSVAR